MIIKKMKGRGFRGVLSYVLNDKDNGQENRAELIGGNMAGQNVQELTQEFRLLRQINPTAKNPVRHFAIRLHPKDPALTEQQWIKLGNDFCNQMGYGNTYKAFVLHRDSHPAHLHIVTSQIGFNGKLAREFKDIPRIKGFCRQKETSLGLHAVSNKATGNAKLYHVRQRGTCKIDAQIRQAKFQSLLKTPTPRPQQSLLVPTRQKPNLVQQKAQDFIGAVFSAAKSNSKWLELVKAEGALVAQMNSLKALLIRAKGTPHEKQLSAQLAQIEQALADNLAARIAAWNAEADQDQKHKQQLRRPKP